jgi:hypothetical protein
MIEKKIKDGMVAVLYSPGHGAGWTTWNDDEMKEFLFFDKTLVEMAEREADVKEVDAYLMEKFGNDNIFTGGWPCQVEWVKVGTRFKVEDYHGWESFIFRDADDWEVAG